MAIVALSLATFAGACNGGDDDADTTTTRAVVTTTTLTANVLARLPAVFVPIPDHTYDPLPGSVLEDLQATLASEATTPAAVAAVDGRSVARDGAAVARVIAIGFDEQVSAAPGFGPSFVNAAMRTATETRELTLSGESALIGSGTSGAYTIAWFKGALGLTVTGNDEESVTNVATALIAANK